MNKFSVLILLFPAFLMACGGSGSDSGSANNESTSNAATEAAAGKTVPVQIQTVQPSVFKHYIQVQGEVESDRTIFITPKTAADVEDILVKRGDDVKKGQVLARLDSRIIRSQIKEIENQLKLAKTIFERQQNLRSEDIGSEVEFLQAQTQYQALRNQLATLNEQLKNFTITATISGTVNNVMMKEGETVGPNDPAFQISNSDALKVTGEVSESYISRVDPSDSVHIYLSSLDTTLVRQIDVVGNVIDRRNRTFGIEIYIDSQNERILPYMSTRLMINDITLNNQMVVAVNVVQTANGDPFLFIAEQNENGWTAAKRTVKTGPYYGNSLVIEDGIAMGDRVIISGYANVSNGDILSVNE
jgi:RND family efflux transporter MFP subunit